MKKKHLKISEYLRQCKINKKILSMWLHRRGLSSFKSVLISTLCKCKYILLMLFTFFGNCRFVNKDYEYILHTYIQQTFSRRHESDFFKMF